MSDTKTDPKQPANPVHKETETKTVEVSKPVPSGQQGQAQSANKQSPAQSQPGAPVTPADKTSDNGRR